MGAGIAKKNWQKSKREREIAEVILQSDIFTITQFESHNIRKQN